MDQFGGPPLGRQAAGQGALYTMLRNWIYCGQIVHKDQHYPGEHVPIIDSQLWDEVQAKLTATAPRESDG